MDFPKWPKIPRLEKMTFRITEKIDGTNGRIRIRLLDNEQLDEFETATTDGRYAVMAGSRQRAISPPADNYGFAKWVWENADFLADYFGETVVYGEWWGQGIQRNYGLNRKKFSLFGVPEVFETAKTIGIETVPILDWGVSRDKLFERVRDLEFLLQHDGSWAAPGWMKPEGLVIQELTSGARYKHIMDK